MIESNDPGTGMEPSQYVYDSITSGALRMARRHWYLIVVAAVVGLLAGFALRGPSTWTADADVRILFESVAPNPVEDPDRVLVDPNSVALRVQEASDEMSMPDDSGFSVVGDSAAGSLQFTATGPTEEAAMAALDSATSYTEALVVRELGSNTRTTITALETLKEGDEARLEAADQRLSELAAAGVSPGPSDPAVLERTAAADALAATNSELQQARSRLDALADTSVGVSAADVEQDPSTPLIPFALAVLGAGAAFAVLLVVQAVDGRIRRRIHLERSAPRGRVVGVLANKPTEGDLAVLGRAASHFVTTNSLDRLLVVSMGAPVPDNAVEAVANSCDCAVESVSLSGAQRELGAPRVGLLLCVAFGRVTEDQLRSAVAASLTAGNDAVAVALTGVPARDRPWASASTF